MEAEQQSVAVPTGSFVSAAGVSMYGGTSGSALATNSNITGMGAIVAAQPSQTPGSVWGKDGKTGSGDVANGNPAIYTKIPAKDRKKKNKNTRKYKLGSEIDNLYTEPNTKRIIMNYAAFHNTDTTKVKSLNTNSYE